jgi:hypothetical protein
MLCKVLGPILSTANKKKEKEEEKKILMHIPGIYLAAFEVLFLWTIGEMVVLVQLYGKYTV